jgi:hypothetical protein
MPILLRRQLVPEEGIEPPLPKELVPKTSASANFATRAKTWWVPQDSNLQRPLRGFSFTD